MKLEFFPKEIRKVPVNPISQKSVHWQSSYSMQTDRQTWQSYSFFSQFCERPEATSRRHVPFVQHRAPTSPLQIMLFCKHLPATQPTHSSVGTLGTFVQPVLHRTAGRHRNLGSLAFNLGCCEKQTLGSPVRMLQRMHRPRFCPLSTQSRRRAIRFIYSKNTQRLDSVHLSDYRLLKADSHIAFRVHAVPLPCRAA